MSDPTPQEHASAPVAAADQKTPKVEPEPSLSDAGRPPQAAAPRDPPFNGLASSTPEKTKKGKKIKKSREVKQREWLDELVKEVAKGQLAQTEQKGEVSYCDAAPRDEDYYRSKLRSFTKQKQKQATGGGASSRRPADPSSPTQFAASLVPTDNPTRLAKEKKQSLQTDHKAVKGGKEKKKTATKSNKRQVSAEILDLQTDQKARGSSRKRKSESPPTTDSDTSCSSKRTKLADPARERQPKEAVSPSRKRKSESPLSSVDSSGNSSSSERNKRTYRPAKADQVPTDENQKPRCTNDAASHASDVATKTGLPHENEGKLHVTGSYESDLREAIQRSLAGSQPATSGPTKEPETQARPDADDEQTEARRYLDEVARSHLYDDPYVADRPYVPRPPAQENYMMSGALLTTPLLNEMCDMGADFEMPTFQPPRDWRIVAPGWAVTRDFLKTVTHSGVWAMPDSAFEGQPDLKTGDGPGQPFETEKTGLGAESASEDSSDEFSAEGSSPDRGSESQSDSGGSE